MPKDCRDTALSYLERRARTAYEMKAHLLAKGFPEEEADGTLGYLQGLGYLDDAGYCREYIRYGKSKGWGPDRRRSALAEKGIDAALVWDVLEEAFDRQTEKEAALREAEKLLRLKSDTSVAKIGRKLLSLGYQSEVVEEVVGRLKAGEAD